jgi:hypothetical protein
VRCDLAALVARGSRLPYISRFRWSLRRSRY